ncbi:MAG: N-acetylmuramic acid 6-phosphate etherase [Chloroherpetonaceae bacterium]|nr:N-acetylmuramic acid 6-phosphate etherase [Chthonomonadaceae bacterium]MDW8208586.1 N-acetylmuramic acid 6-phosphate etherase [Chloroherpetonaceae bacterium]
MEDLAHLETEQRNPRTMDLDTLPPPALVAVLHAESRAAFDAVEAILPSIAQVVEVIAQRLSQGGRLFYVGAGTSGRLGVLDASECPPTFGVPADTVQGIIAGGHVALTTSIEGAEDRPESGAADLHARHVTAADVVVGIAASGRTPYVIGAMQAAREIGAFTVGVVNVTQPALASCADIVLSAVTGPEALTGSTRLKAGTAQKLILNLLTTAAMVRMGKVYSNLMVDVQATNTKLRDRAARIVMAATGVDRGAAEAALNRAGGHCKVAIVMLALGVSAEEAAYRLQVTGGWVRAALASCSNSSA